MWTTVLLIGMINKDIQLKMLMFSFILDSIKVFSSVYLANSIKRRLISLQYLCVRLGT